MDSLPPISSPSPDQSSKRSENRSRRKVQQHGAAGVVVDDICIVPNRVANRASPQRDLAPIHVHRKRTDASKRSVLQRQREVHEKAAADLVDPGRLSVDATQLTSSVHGLQQRHSPNDSPTSSPSKTSFRLGMPLGSPTQFGLAAASVPASKLSPTTSEAIRDIVGTSWSPPRPEQRRAVPEHAGQHESWSHHTGGLGETARDRENDWQHIQQWRRWDQAQRRQQQAEDGAPSYHHSPLARSSRYSLNSNLALTTPAHPCAYTLCIPSARALWLWNLPVARFRTQARTQRTARCEPRIQHRRR
jgi:hypothetical protein